MIYHMNDYSKTSTTALTYRIITKGLAAIVLFILVSILIFMIYSLGIVTEFPWHLVLILAAVPAAWLMLTAWLDWSNMGYTFDDKSLILKEGTFSLQTQTIPFYKISNASFNQTFFQRFFNVGDVIIDQEDSQSDLKGVDRATAEIIIQAVSEHSNIQTVQAAR